MKSRATSLVMACLRPSSCHSDKAIMLSSAMNGANPANPFGGSGERCNVGDGDVRFAILSREYMLDLPMTHDSMAVAFYNVSPVKKGTTRSGTHDCEVHFGMSRIEKGLFDQTAPCFLVDDGDRNMMD